MAFVNNWQVMTPLDIPAGQHTRRYVRWTIATMFAKDAVKMAEQRALELGLKFDGDITVQQVGHVLTPGE